MKILCKARNVYDISDLFEKEELQEFANDVVDKVNDRYKAKFDILDLYTYQNAIILKLYDTNDENVDVNTHIVIDRRKVKTIKDLYKYRDSILEDIDDQLKWYDGKYVQSSRRCVKSTKQRKRNQMNYTSIKASDEEFDLDRPDQEYDSANTSINSTKLPAIYKLVDFHAGDMVLDYGGGKFDNAVNYLADKDVTLLVYDPYNRSAEHNREVVKALRQNGGADAAVCSNVLNVIKESEARLGVLKNIQKLTKSGGDIYITVYEGSGRGNEGPTKSGYQLNRKTEGYLDEIREVFPDAKRKGKLVHATNITTVNSNTKFIKNDYDLYDLYHTINSIQYEVGDEFTWKDGTIYVVIDDQFKKGNRIYRCRPLDNFTPSDYEEVFDDPDSGITDDDMYIDSENLKFSAIKSCSVENNRESITTNSSSIMSSIDYGSLNPDYIHYNRIADYIVDNFDWEDIDDKYACINSLRESFKGEEYIAKDIIGQFIGAHNGKDKVTASMYNVNYTAAGTVTNKVYWYFTRHGVQPGSIPDSIDTVYDVIDTPEGTYFATNTILNTQELREYEIKEKWLPDNLKDQTNYFDHNTIVSATNTCNISSTPTIMSASDTFDYQMLSRLQYDCEYYLGYGNRNPNVLWAKDEQEQIDKMRELYDQLDPKPEWITSEDIDEYEHQMVDTLTSV